MSDFDAQLLATLDRLYPPITTGGDWQKILERAELLRRAKQRSKTRRPVAPSGWAPRRLALVASAAVVALVASLAATAPWKGGPNFIARALAAIGSSRYIVATVEPVVPSANDVDLATGKERPVRVTATYWLDTRRPENQSRIYFDGVPASSLISGPDPAIGAFAKGYRAALANGGAHIVGKTTVGRRSARIIRFPITTLYLDGNKIQFPGGVPTMWEDVAVDEKTYQPLWFSQGGLVHANRASDSPPSNVLSIKAVPSLPPVPKSVPFYVGSVTALRILSRTAALSALGTGPLWDDTRLDTLPLRSIVLQRVTSSVYPVVYPPLRTGRGLRFVYQQGRSKIEINESTTPLGGYGFAGPTRTSDLGAIPREGIMRISKFSGTFTAAQTLPGAGTVPTPWAGQLRSGNLYLTIRATSKSLLIQAGRSLRVMR